MAATNKTKLKQGPHTAKIDWIEARKFYMEDATRSYQDVAMKFGVAKRTVEVQARNADDGKGGKSTWAILRQAMGEEATNQHEEQLVADTAGRNEEHRRMWTQVQNLALLKLASFEAEIEIDKDGKPKLTIEALELYRTAKALAVGIDGERVTLGLATSVSALTGKNGENFGGGWAELLAEAIKVAGGTPNTRTS